MNGWMVICLLMSSYLLTLFWYHAFYHVCNRHIVRENYQKKTIPTAMGISITLTVVVLICTLPGSGLAKQDLVLLVSMLMATCVGLLDDIANDRRIKGISGHLQMLWKRKTFTSGGLKAIILTGTAVWTSTQLTESWLEMPIGATIIALTANTINLFDLRPGRAMKAVILMLLVLFGWIAFHSSISSNFLWKWCIILIGTCLAYIPKDLKGYAMMGDTGANALGILLGSLCLSAFPFGYQWIMLILLLGIHGIAEIHSISAIIDDNKWLRWLDQWGRPKQCSADEPAVEPEDIQPLPNS
ncbi:hypothetical protein LSG31_18910 [Fodinisporobacter ferrooxydans]|uniref:Phospho-N-acetylmuramoyl-pentapeptide-transferase n=1 Tax=Fodinisporobacter ferrooxydans TaxID=2901836 RepID=A0ABY4CKY8_9BACL|nr:hypothetical protein LSG31_18910 [Alicyclobacillaceae bacterium MYW30-H2]